MTSSFKAGFLRDDTTGALVVSSQSSGAVSSAEYWNAAHADDTLSWQAAADAAVTQSRPLILTLNPHSSVATLSDTIVIGDAAPGSSARFSMPIDFGVGGLNTSIVWAGGNDKSVFSVWGLCFSQITGAKVNLPTDAEGVVVWDVDITTGQNSQCNIWSGCAVFGGKATGGGANIGWRVGHSVGLGGSADLSDFTWQGCVVSWGVNSLGLYGGYGWVIEGGNSINFRWYGGGFLFCNVGVTDVPTAGGPPGSGAAMYFRDMSCGRNEVDFQISAAGLYEWSGGRYELGKKFLDAIGGGSSVGMTCKVDVWLDAYVPSDGVVFDLQCPVSLDLGSTFCSRNTSSTEAGALAGVPYDENFISASCASGNYGSINLHDSQIFTDATVPVTVAASSTDAAGTWRVEATRNVRLDDQFQTAGEMPDGDDLRALVGGTAALAAWYDADRSSGKDGDAIALAEDFSGNARHIAQATSGARPTLRKGVRNGRAVWVFDGTDDFLQLSFTLDQPCQLFLVGKLTAAPSTPVNFLSGDNASDLGGLVYGGSNNVAVSAGTTLVRPNVDPLDWHVYDVLFDGANSHLTVDGRTVQTGDAGAGDLSGLTIAAHGAGTVRFSQLVFGELIVTNAAVPVGAAAQIRRALRSRWATPR